MAEAWKVVHRARDFDGEFQTFRTHVRVAPGIIIRCIHATQEESDALADRVIRLPLMEEALRLIGCDWCGIGHCPQCGGEHGATYPKSSEDLLRAIARLALGEPAKEA